MLKTIRVMLIPNDKQQTRLFQFSGSARFAYNWALSEEKKIMLNAGNFCQIMNYADVSQSTRMNRVINGFTL